MSDELAIALFVKAGNPRGDWLALDDRDRWPWRKLATQENLRVVRLDNVAKSVDKANLIAEKDGSVITEKAIFTAH